MYVYIYMIKIIKHETLVIFCEIYTEAFTIIFIWLFMMIQQDLMMRNDTWQWEQAYSNMIFPATKTATRHGDGPPQPDQGFNWWDFQGEKPSETGEFM